MFNENKNLDLNWWERRCCEIDFISWFLKEFYWLVGLSWRWKLMLMSTFSVTITSTLDTHINTLPGKGHLPSKLMSVSGSCLHSNDGMKQCRVLLHVQLYEVITAAHTEWVIADVGINYTQDNNKWLQAANVKIRC